MCHNTLLLSSIQQVQYLDCSVLSSIERAPTLWAEHRAAPNHMIGVCVTIPALVVRGS